MEITIINNIWSKVDLPSIEELREFLSYRETRWELKASRRRPVFYNRTFVGKENGFFFTGFIPHLLTNFPSAKINNRRIYPRITADSIPVSLGGKLLRPYQKNMILRAVESGRGIIKAPTGSGKTIIEAGIIKVVDVESLVIVHTKTLLYQVKKELEIFLGESIGVVGDGTEDWRRITIGMIQTLSKIDRSILRQKNIHLVLVEETHHAVAKTYSFVLNSIDAKYKFGLSATPKDIEDEKGQYLTVIGTIGPIIGIVEFEEVKEVLAIPNVEMLRHDGNDDTDQLRRWKDVYKYGIEENEKRNLAIAEYAIKRFEESPCGILIHVKTIAHGFNIQKLIKNSIFITGESDKDRRDMAKFLLSKGRIVIATSVFGEGVDIPALDVAVNAGAGLSKIQTIQRAGRALRKTETKSVGTIVDLIDDGNKYLARHTRERINMYKKLGWLKG